MEFIIKIPTLSVLTDISVPFSLKLAMSCKFWEAVITTSAEQKSPSLILLKNESSLGCNTGDFFLLASECCDCGPNYAFFLDTGMPWGFFCANVNMAEFDQLDFNLPWFVTQFCQLSSLGGMENWCCFSPECLFTHQHSTQTVKCAVNEKHKSSVGLPQPAGLYPLTTRLAKLFQGNSAGWQNWIPRCLPEHLMMLSVTTNLWNKAALAFIFWEVSQKETRAG